MSGRKLEANRPSLMPVTGTTARPQRPGVRGRVGPGWPRSPDGGNSPLLHRPNTIPSDSHGLGAGKSGALPSAALQTVYVAPTGSDGTGCGSRAVSPCATLAYAINSVANAVQPQDGLVDVFLASGKYGPAGCGAQATRPVRVVGSGSGTTTMDCGGQFQLLATNSSVVVAGLSIVGCLTTSMTVVPGTGGVLSVGGGAAIAVVWPPDLDGAVADLRDVCGAHNVASLTPVGPPDAMVCVGGGAVLVVGGGAGASVSLHNTSFVNNTVLVNGSFVDPAASLVVGGGALCLAPGLAVVPGQAAVGISLLVESLSATGNTVGCSGCPTDYYIGKQVSCRNRD